MKHLIVLACGLLAAAPALAGDKPVIVTVKPPVVDYYVGTGPIRYYAGTETVTSTTSVDYNAGDSSASPAAAITGQNRVSGSGISRVEADALYARLLSEAKARKLR